MINAWKVPNGIDIPEDQFCDLLQQHYKNTVEEPKIGYFAGYYIIEELIANKTVYKYHKSAYAWPVGNGKYQVTFFRNLSIVDRVVHFIRNKRISRNNYKIWCFFTDDITYKGLVLCDEYESPWAMLGMDNSCWCGKCARCNYLLVSGINSLYWRH